MIFAFFVIAAAGMGLALLAAAHAEPRRIPVRVRNREADHRRR